MVDGSGIVASADEFIGSGGAAFSPFAASASGTYSPLNIAGTGSAAMSPLGAAGAGTELFTGTGSAAADSLACTGTGAETFAGTGSAALDPLFAAGAATVAISFIGSGGGAFASFGATGRADNGVIPWFPLPVPAASGSTDSRVSASDREGGIVIVPARGLAVSRPVDIEPAVPVTKHLATPASVVSKPAASSTEPGRQFGPRKKS